MAVRPSQEQPHGLHRKWNPKLVFKGYRNIYILCQIPVRGLLKEIPKNPLFSPWIGNTCFCIAYDIAFTVETLRLKIIFNRLPKFDLTYLQQTLFLIISAIG